MLREAGWTTAGLIALIAGWGAAACYRVDEMSADESADGAAVDADADADSDGDADGSGDSGTGGARIVYSCSEEAGTCSASNGLVWEWTEVSLDEIDMYAFSSASNYCDELRLGGYGDWRLPTFDELRTLVQGCPAMESRGACGISDACVSPEACAAATCSYCAGGMGPEYDGEEEPSCPSAECPNPGCKLCGAFYEGPCTGCEGGEGPGNEGCYFDRKLPWTCMAYWSSTSVPGLEDHAWGIDFRMGAPTLSGTWSEGYDIWSSVLGVRCVREE